jgi:hypothetical protein
LDVSLLLPLSSWLSYHPDADDTPPFPSPSPTPKTNTGISALLVQFGDPADDPPVLPPVIVETKEERQARKDVVIKEKHERHLVGGSTAVKSNPV